MAFIRTIAPSEAEGPVREMYQHAEHRFGDVIGIMLFNMMPLVVLCVVG